MSWPNFAPFFSFLSSLSVLASSFSHIFPSSPSVCLHDFAAYFRILKSFLLPLPTLLFLLSPLTPPSHIRCWPFPSLSSFLPPMFVFCHRVPPANYLLYFFAWLSIGWTLIVHPISCVCLLRRPPYFRTLTIQTIVSHSRCLLFSISLSLSLNDSPPFIFLASFDCSYLYIYFPMFILSDVKFQNPPVNKSLSEPHVYSIHYFPRFKVTMHDPTHDWYQSESRHRHPQPSSWKSLSPCVVGTYLLEQWPSYEADQGGESMVRG